jgi:hypothetical protein
MKLRNLKLWAAIFGISCLIVAAVAQGFADGHRESRHSSEASYYSEQTAYREDGGDSGSGIVAGWLFGIANFPVALSILLKAFGKMAPPNSSIKETLKKTNVQQKKYLMNLHYWLNPLAAGVAIFHFVVAECRSTFFPELGLIVMLLIFILGLMITFKLAPQSMSRTVFKLHTSPISLTVVLSILLIGHAMVD